MNLATAINHRVPDSKHGSPFPFFWAQRRGSSLELKNKPAFPSPWPRLLHQIILVAGIPDSERVNVPDELFWRRHECDRVLRTVQAAARDGQASVVVVITKAGFATPHGERRTSLKPAVEHRSDIEVSIRRKAIRIFPVFGEKDSLDGVSRLLACESWESSIEHSVVYDLGARLVILVPAPVPVGHDDVELCTRGSDHTLVVLLRHFRESRHQDSCETRRARPACALHVPQIAAGGNHTPLEQS